MNRKHLIVSLAILASCATLSTSLALYVSAPDDVNINIATATGTDITLDCSYDDSSSQSLSPSQKYVLPITLKATKTASSTYTQDTYVGKISVTVSSTSQALITAMTGTFKAGYATGTYFGDTAALNQATLGTISGETTYSKTLSMYAPVTIGATGLTNSLTLDLSTMSAADFTAVSGTGYNLSINYQKPDTDYTFAYVVGTMTDWGEIDAYQMVPDLAATSYTWKWDAGTNPIAAGKEFKAHKGGTAEGAYFSSGDNWVVSTGKKVTKVTWAGSSTDAVVATAVDA